MNPLGKERTSFEAPEASVFAESDVPLYKESLRLVSHPSGTLYTFGLETDSDIEAPVEHIRSGRTPEIVRGKSITKWSIERRRVSKDLSGYWNLALAGIEDQSFALYVDKLESRIDEVIPEFRDVPYEDAFAGVLQLIQNMLQGDNYLLLREKKSSVLTQILTILIKEDRLNLEKHREVLKKLLNEGFTFSREKASKEK